jgi:translation elongation factor EF-4
VHLVSPRPASACRNLAAICEKFPPPRKPVTDKLRALIFDAVYDDYRGVIVYVRILDGKLKVGDKIRMMGQQRTFQCNDIGKMTPKPVRVTEVGPGETAYVVAAIRSLKDVRIGDTVTLENNPAEEALPGYQPPRQMVFCDFYPATDEEGRRGLKTSATPSRNSPQRLLLHLRPRPQRGPRLRLPLRLRASSTWTSSGTPERGASRS